VPGGIFPRAHPTPNGWLVALASDRSLEELHPPPAGAGHGHTRVLLPDLSVLKQPALRGELRPRDLTSEERRMLGGLDAAALRRRLESWLGRAERREGEEPRRD
jgi:hypothetical protein